MFFFKATLRNLSHCINVTDSTLSRCRSQFQSFWIIGLCPWCDVYEGMTLFTNCTTDCHRSHCEIWRLCILQGKTRFQRRPLWCTTRCLWLLRRLISYFARNRKSFGALYGAARLSATGAGRWIVTQAGVGLLPGNMATKFRGSSER